MPDNGGRGSSILVCKTCGQEIKPVNRMEIIHKVMDRLRRETGYGEKPKK